MYEDIKSKVEDWAKRNKPELVEAVKSNFQDYHKFGFMSLVPLATTALWVIITEPNQSVEERKNLSQLVIDVLDARLANV